ncbi:MAG: hypothetical protein AAFX85_17870 [Pseudomonadota bacterium]
MRAGKLISLSFVVFASALAISLPFRADAAVSSVPPSVEATIKVDAATPSSSAVGDRFGAAQRNGAARFPGPPSHRAT